MYQYRYIQYLYGYESSTGQYFAGVIECHEPKPHASGNSNRDQCRCRQLLSDHEYRGFERCPECYGKASKDLRYIEKIYESTGTLIGRKEHKNKEADKTLPKPASVDRTIEDEWEDASSRHTSYTAADLEPRMTKKSKRLRQREEASFPTCVSTENNLDVSIFDGCDEGSGSGRISPDLIFELELNYPDSESRAYISKVTYSDELILVAGDIDCYPPLLVLRVQFAQMFFIPESRIPI